MMKCSSRHKLVHAGSLFVAGVLLAGITALYPVTAAESGIDITILGIEVQAAGEVEVISKGGYR